MADLLRRAAMDDAQGQVVVLATLQAKPEAADRDHAVPPVDAEVVDDVLAEELLVAVVGLEVGVVAFALLVDLVLVGVDDFGIGMGVQLDGDLIEGVLGQKVVMIQESDERAARQFQGAVAGGGDMAVALALDPFDARIAGREFGQQGGDMRLGRGVVGDAQFPVRIELRLYRFDHLTQDGGRGVVGRHDHRDEGLIGQLREMRPDRLPIRRRQRVVPLHPVTIDAITRISASMSTFYLAMLQVVSQRFNVSSCNIGIDLPIPSRVEVF
ncbi:Uncharacterised protein [Starkeya nomas]|uniref:Uncharacterized protein n=1 Tax=Starkeya nomas TaxID=2666134 RepID=A0A5S9NDF3_9HYPH|nr:Uncharacterised protein [Starkeya nomas]